MTQKVNGFNKQGAWFERDTSIVHAASTATPFTTPITVREGVGGASETVMNVMQTRGTVIAYAVTDDASDNNASYMFGHAAGYWAPDAG